MDNDWYDWWNWWYDSANFRFYGCKLYIACSTARFRNSFLLSHAEVLFSRIILFAPHDIYNYIFAMGRVYWSPYDFGVLFFI